MACSALVVDAHVDTAVSDEAGYVTRLDPRRAETMREEACHVHWPMVVVLVVERGTCAGRRAGARVRGSRGSLQRARGR